MPELKLPRLPQTVSSYKRTPEFSAKTVPPGLLRDHQTKAGTWGRLVVLRGEVTYQTADGTISLRPGADGVIEPEMIHRVTLSPDARFYVEFLR